MERAKILILGSTGSIGKSACNCARRFRERFDIAGLSAGNNVELLMEQIREFAPKCVYVTDVDHAKIVKQNFADVTVYNSNDRIERIVEECDYDILLNALVGAVGFAPTVAALKRGKRVALANKESLVIGGDYIKTIINDNNIGNNISGDKRLDRNICDDKIIRDDKCISNNKIISDNKSISDNKIISNDIKNRAQLLPVDSEHSAILQCLPNGFADNTIESIILTASGGPFRDLPKDKFASITPEHALNHPTWSMGKKITIDSATLMNKGFEIIEAHHLFSLPYSQLRVCIHPQSIIHSLVEFHDGAMLAQLGLPDMELPIQYALSWPDRLPISGKRLSLTDIKTFDFFEPDMDKFPCLRLCIEAGKTGGTAPAAVNAANEVAVDLFLNRKIAFTDIAKIVERELNDHKTSPVDSVDVVTGVDKEIRERLAGSF